MGETERNLTRRRFLVLGGGALLVPAAARSSVARASLGGDHGASVFSMPVPTDSRAAYAARARVIGPLRAPGRFDLVGFRWGGKRAPRIELRTRRRGGGWSDWLRIPHAHHGPDGHRAVRGTDPVWTGGADEFELRVDRPLDSLKAHFVNSTGTLTAVGRARAAARRSAAAARHLLSAPHKSAIGSKPKIIPRSEWGGDTVPPKADPEYGQVKLAFVHHTVGTNNYGPEDSAAIVLGIAKYHRNVNGWNDIGYNFLVDKYGQIFEGRAGGIERAVVGAQAQGYNSASTGVSNLGTFSTVEQTPAGIDACAALIAWKLALHGVPVTGTVDANGKTFERISGHRDANSTECPGDALYGQLSQIRSRAASGGGGGGTPAPSAALSLAAAKPAFGIRERVKLSGVLSLVDGSRPRGAVIELQRQDSSGYRTFMKVRTRSDGQWVARFRRSSNARVRARFKGSDGKHVFSDSARVVIAPSVTARVDRSRVPVGGRVAVAGLLRPAKGKVSALLERRGADGSFTQVKSVSGRARRGRYRLGLRLPHSGVYRITVRTPADSRNGSGQASRLSVRVGGKASKRSS